MVYIFTLCSLILNYLPLSAIHSEQHHVVRRAALDIGSGGIRIQVSDIDLDENRVIRDLFSDSVVIHLRDDLAKSLDGNVSQKIEDEIVNAVVELKERAEGFHPQESHAIATASFRLAKNHEHLIERIRNESGISTTVISQEEEGILGFLTATHQAKSDPNKTIVWDVGGGSFQITAKSEDGYLVYRGKLGRIPMKNALLAIQGKDQEAIPNPVSKEDAIQAVQLVQDLLSDAPQDLREKIRQPDVTVLAVGLHPLYFIDPNATHFDAHRLNEEINALLGLDSATIQALYSNGKETDQKSLVSCIVSSLLMAYGIMDSLGIEKVQYEHTPGGNASGVLLSPQFWTR